MITKEELRDIERAVIREGLAHWGDPDDPERDPCEYFLYEKEGNNRFEILVGEKEFTSRAIEIKTGAEISFEAFFKDTDMAYDVELDEEYMEDPDFGFFMLYNRKEKLARYFMTEMNLRQVKTTVAIFEAKQYDILVSYLAEGIITLYLPKKGGK